MNVGRTVGRKAAIGGKVIARKTIAALSKDMTAKCYGTDIDRKNRLLDEQTGGKSRMRKYRKVSTPKEALYAALLMGKVNGGAAPLGLHLLCVVSKLVLHQR